MIETVLLVIVAVLLTVLIAVVLMRTGGQGKDVEASISRAWLKLGLPQTIGAVDTHAKEIKESYRSFEQMLRVPKERASFGELALEAILSDQLPPDAYAIRERVLDGKIPDASIKSTSGLVCVDSKFPLDNYRNMVEAQDEGDRERLKRQFLKQDVQGHLSKIADDYVCPDKGSADFAFAYIPSEAVYYFLVSEAFEMLRDFTKRGVQVVSPLTLSHKVELIKAGVHARKLSEEAERVSRQLQGLARRFATIDESWRVLRTHLRNLQNKTEELDEEYRRLRQEFDSVSAMTEVRDAEDT
ncbi:MAG: DNA recombination protein RmuC [Chloroflexota bacterium]|nr:DNA recombination protein RmuC [Chloroflexota bacterium]